jgi:molecular chaperone DnaJ
MAMHGEGHFDSAGGRQGDIVVEFEVKEHERFERHGKDLLCRVPVTFAQAALGAEAPVPTLDGGRVMMTIPAGTQSGKIFRLRGKGIPRIRRSAFGEQWVETGDELVMAVVWIPSRMTAKQKDLLRQFAEAGDGADLPDERSFLHKIKDLFGEG